MEFRVLGPLEVVEEGCPVPLSGAKQRALLSTLLLHPNEPVSTDRIVHYLWGDHPPDTAHKLVQVYVSQLRRVLDPGRNTTGDARLITRPPGYMLRLEPDELDGARFERLAAEGREALAKGRPADARAKLGEALELWRGEAFADSGVQSSAVAQIQRLTELHVSAQEDRLDADLALGRHGDVVGDIQALVSRFPLRERLRGLLMLALYRSGRQAEALGAYERTRTVLADELGIDPGLELRALHTAILRHDPALAPSRPDTGGIQAPGTEQTGTLPTRLTSFVGREKEIATVRGLLRNARLVTLTGAGGCGKSRLAMQVAVEMLADYPDGVWLIELARLRNGDLIPQAISSTLGCAEQPGRRALDTLAEYVRDRRLLLILDNCEHVVDACAAVADSLIAASREVRILATSREPLALEGESCFQVPMLSLPAADEQDAIDRLQRYEAVTLFVERAAAARPGFRLDRRSAGPVVQICRRLDGMPLALELAAARIRTMSPEQIEERIGDRFRLLRSGSRNVLPHHQTLQATMEWSFELLSQKERTLLTRLCVFAGGFTLADAEGVCAGGGIDADDILDLTGRLVEKSLLIADYASRDGRYRALETVRQFGIERLRETGEEAVRARHATFFLRVAQDTSPRLRGADAGMWLDRMEDEHDNFRTAMSWLIEAGDAESELRLAAALARFCYLHGHYREGREWLQAALGHAPGAPKEVVAAALDGAGGFAFLECDYHEAERLIEQSLRLFRDAGESHGVGEALTLLGAVAREKGQYERAVGLHEEALGVFLDIGDDWSVAHSLQMSGFAAWLSGDYDSTIKLSGEALKQFRRLGDKERTAWALLDLGAVHHYRGESERAKGHLLESHDLFRKVRFKEGIAWSKNILGLVARVEGDAPAAVALLAESLALHRELGDRWRASSVLEALAGVVMALDGEKDAARLLGAAESLRLAIGAPIPPVEALQYEDDVIRLRDRLGDEGLATLWEEGSSLTLEDASEIVHTLVARDEHRVNH